MYVEEPEAVRSHEQLVRDYLEVRSQLFPKQLICKLCLLCKVGDIKIWRNDSLF